MTEYDNPWWNWVQRAMAEAGSWNITDLAKATSIQRSSIYMWREKNTPAPETVRTVAIALGKEPTEAFIALGWLKPDEIGGVLAVSSTASLTKTQLLTELALRIPGDEVTIGSVEDAPLKRAPRRSPAKKLPAKKALRSSTDKPKRG